SKEPSMDENVSRDSDPIDCLSTIASFTKPQMRPTEEKVEPKEEPNDITQGVTCDNEMPHSDFMEDGMPSIDEIVEKGRQISLDESIEMEGEDEEGTNDAANTPEVSPETLKVEKRKRSTRSASKPAKYIESMDDSEGEEELPVKKAGSESVNGGDKAYPTTALGYASHLQRHHKSSLKSNGIYLVDWK
ncbi:hypothetical protein PENTCL1PPCAC_19688, partial [Pristionchus entomophagus]